MNSQTEKLYNLLSDMKPHRTDEILHSVYGGSHLGIARISARIYDVKRKYHVEIESRRDTVNETLYWYQIIPSGNSRFDIINEESRKMEEQRKQFSLQKPLF